MFKFLKLKENKSFTLVELLVATTIFSIIVTSIIGVLISVIRIQEYSLNHQRLLSQTSYLMEYMSRSIRMAKRGDGSCVSVGQNYDYKPLDHSITFFNQNNNECWKFYLENDQLKVLETKKDGSSYDLNLTSSDLSVKNFNVSIVGDSSGSQPKVTIFLSIEGKKGTGSHIPRIKIQTTLSQRDLNI